MMLVFLLEFRFKEFFAIYCFTELLEGSIFAVNDAS